MKEKQTLTTGDIAKYCGVNFRTVIRWIKRGHLKAFQLPGRGDNRVEHGDFLEFLKAHRMAIPEGFDGGGHVKVLVVDDDQRMATSIRRALEAAGFETTPAYDGFHAGALMGSFAPDVITLDLEMPNLSGIEVIRFVRDSEHFRKVKILVVSALGRENLAEAVREGADDALTKPFSNDELVEKVRRLSGTSNGVRKIA
jgi:excisionase family DNA binding protein